MPPPAIRIEDVSFSYGEVRALEHIDLEIREGEFVALVGPNGGGKSTLLRILLGLLEPDSGRVELLGRPPEIGRRAVGYVPQAVHFDRDFPLRVRDMVLMGRLGTGGTRRIGYTREDHARAEDAMRRTEILHLAERQIGTLSGGQFQRALIARALTSDPRILILDEPTANIDQRSESDIFELFRALNARMTILVVSHDIGFISRYVDRVACLNRTLLCHETREVDQKVLERLYGMPVREIAHRH
ncbi:MAG: metal ABC transporter ATP-binding protein [Gammaproteobacteria bacterium]|nr:MAG: metal ABC transporter ATP-binding protein [Gammaproteobacteria bacterium]